MIWSVEEDVNRSIYDNWGTILKKVHDHYRKTPASIEAEGLVEYKGPQNFFERNIEEKLYYYGLGWYKWYKRSIFEEKMVGLYGSASRQLALLLFGSDPFTEKIEHKEYELLLKQTNEAIIKHMGTEDWKNKLTPFSGPQCNEDRGKKYCTNIIQI